MKLPRDKVYASDFEVTRHFLSNIEQGLAGVGLSGTSWALVTRDKGFWNSARHGYNSSNRSARPKMLFIKNGRRQYVLAVIRKKLICIEILRLGSKQIGAGTLWDLDQAYKAVQDWLA